MPRPIAILFVRADSIYRTLEGVDCWDAKRDARLWPGGSPVVAHPPCAQWSLMRHLATADAPMKELALLAVKLVRQNGGVLEHPAGSDLWNVAKLPRGADRDRFGGHTLSVSQKWWGHLCEKKTHLYIVGCAPIDIPPIPYLMHEAEAVIDTGSRNKKYLGVGPPRKYLPKSQRDVTPPTSLAGSSSSRAVA